MKLKASKNIEIWGLTGGMGAGKSTAAQTLENQGLLVIDADQISRDLSKAGGKAYPQIVKMFGSINRPQLRELIFNQPQAKKELEEILHPLIREESIRRIQEYAKNLIGTTQKLRVIYEAALLVETKAYTEFTGLILIDTPLEIRKKRIMARDGISSELTEKIFAAQATEEERRKAATFIIDNSGTPEELEAAVIRLAETLQGSP